MGFTAIAATALAVSTVGTVSQMNAASEQADAQKQQVAIEQQQEAQRQKQMEISARRQQLEVVRQQQRARSMALSSSVAQGAQFGSGLQGGYGQIAGQSNFNMLGIDQNLQFGQNMFNLNAQLSQNKMDQATIAGDAAFGAGLTSLGGAILKGLPTMRNIFEGGSSGGLTYTDYGTGGPQRPMYR